MSNSDVDYGWDFIQRQQPDSAVASLFGDPDGDPAVAAKAVQMAADTGVPAPAIYADPERFQRQQMAAWASELVRENPHLQSFLTDDPMAAKIAKNDIANLDTASQAISKLRKAHEVFNPYRTIGRVAPAMWHGATEGFGEQPMMSWLDSSAPGIWQSNPSAAAAWTLLGYPVEAVFRSINAGVKGLAEGSRVQAEELYKFVTGNESEAKRFARDIAGMVEAELMGESGRGHTPHPPKPFEGIATPKDFANRKIEQQDAMWQMRNELAKIRSWIDGGEEPPPGISGFIDQIRANQSREGVKDLMDAHKESHATETNELSPETYRKFVEQHETANVEINGDAVRKLYGDKAPEIDDGLFGNVVGIGDNLETALATGGDVTIRMSDWIALEPDVVKALKDDVRVGPGSLTLNEIKDKAFAPKGEAKDLGPIEDPLPMVRAGAGLEPLFSIGDRKVTLKRAKEVERSYTGETQFHDFDLVDQNGQTVGSLNLSLQKGGKQLYVEMIQAGPREKKMYDPNFLGPALIRDLYRQIKAEFPEVFGPGGLGLTGHRVSGAREKAGTWEEKHAMPVVLKSEVDLRRLLARVIDDTAQRAEVTPGYEVTFRPPEDWTRNEQRIAQAIQEEIQRIAPSATARVVESIEKEGAAAAGGRVEAIYMPGEPGKDMLIFTLMSQDPIGDVHHEAIHRLRRGFFTGEEWNTLKDAALENNWHGKFGIERFYKDVSVDVQMEEAIAEAFRDWMKNKEVKYPAEVQGLFERLKQFFERMKERIQEILGRDVTWEEIFQRVDTGEVGRRERMQGTAGKEQPLESVKPPPIPRQGELDVTRMENREPFRPGAMLPVMTKDMQQRYMDAIAKRNEEDFAAAEARATRLQKAKQTEQWKKDREIMRSEVEKEINRRPDIAADLFFSRGELYGERIGGKPKVDPNTLPPEIREQLKSTDWVKEGGMDATDAANLFGFRSPEQMFDALAEYHMQRPEGIGAKRMRDMIVENETNRQMELRYGRLEDNIISEARDLAASETQLNLLHEETMFLALQGKAEFSITKEQMKQWAEESFGKATFADMTSAKMFQTAGKHGRAAEEALLKDDAAGAFVAKQAQYRATAMAAQALKLEKEKAQFEKQVAKVSKREVKNVDREFVDFVQEMLIGSNIKLRVTADEVQASKLFHGNSSLKTFIEDGAGHGWGLEGEISPELQFGMFKDINTMSINDFRDLKDAVDSLMYVGRRSEKIYSQGRLQEKKAVVDSIIDNLVKREKLDPDKELSNLHKLLAVTKRPEQIIKDLDDHAELGPAFRNLWEPMTIASADFLRLERDLTKKVGEMTSGNKQWMKSLNEAIPNDFFFDPHDGTLFNLNRGHLIRIMLNWGNEGNIKKFVNGWAAYDKPTKAQVADFRSRVEDLIQRNARPEDWKYVRDVWDIFQGWQAELDTVHRNTTGKLPKWVRPDAIKLPDGSTISEGGYFPLIPDRTRLIPGTGFDPLPNIKNGVMQRDYYRPATTKTHMMERQVNAQYRVSFLGDMGEVALRMQQVMHDIAYREGLMDVSGLLADKRLRNAIKERYSPEYLKQLDAWLVRQANHLNYDEIAMAGMNNILQRVRQNLVAYALPLNLNVILSPALGLSHPGQWMRTLWDYSSMEKLANEHSRVVPHTEYNIDRDFREHIEAMAQRKGWDRIRTEAVKKAYWPMIALEQRLRTVTFYTEFNKARERGLSDYDASQVADSAVRERHGAQTMTDLPTVMASNEGYKLMTMFMGYFNTMDNWSRQIPGQVRRGEYMKSLQTAWGAIIIPALFGGFLFNKAKEDDSYWKIAGKAISLQMTQGIPFFREFASQFVEGYKPTTPIGSLASAMYQAGHDAYKYTQGKPVGNVVRHVAGAAGIGLGIPGTLQAGKTGQFLYDYSRGKQRPRDLIEWWRGLRTGEAQLKRGGG